MSHSIVSMSIRHSTYVDAVSCPISLRDWCYYCRVKDDVWPMPGVPRDASEHEAGLPAVDVASGPPDRAVGL